MTIGYKTIGYRLRKHRHLMGYTIREAAALIGIGPIRLSQWERNIRKPGIENVVKLAVLYRVLVDELCLDMRRASVDKMDNGNKSTRKSRPP